MRSSPSFTAIPSKKKRRKPCRLTLQPLHEDRAVELYDGGQPYAHYLISVE